MNPVFTHPWNLTPSDAVALQRRLAGRVTLCGKLPISSLLVAGLDISGTGRWSRRDEKLTAGVIVLRFPGGEIVESAFIQRPSPFPYLPGLLSFREAPVYVELLALLRTVPDLLLCDGQGIAHPRRFGLASHLGVLFDIPAIGVAKSRLCGSHRAPGQRRGGSTLLKDGGDVIGRVLRTQNGVRPLFVSPGHRIGIAEATRIVLSLAPRYRLPEPTRLADHWVGALRRAGGAEVAPPRPVAFSSRIGARRYSIGSSQS